ncbi:hypothetical protein [Echinicola salinicaeni]|uniref:hypothetical protein n=1 Tax=Echinicola salinicaeni TaxID=2762757 RepID=UPI0016451C3B|nr:hypothetical protein [Echinicola salinicaeni]
MILLLLNLFSCNAKDEEILKGDLVFKMIDFASAYGGTDEQIEELNNYLYSIQGDENAQDWESETLSYFSKLKENDLFESPYIFVRPDHDSAIVTVFLNEEEFTKVKEYKRSSLMAESKKVELVLEVKKIDSLLYFSDNVIDVTEVEGDTYFSK